MDSSQADQASKLAKISSSSSSSDSSAEDLFQLDPKCSNPNTGNLPEAKNGTTSVNMPGKPPLSPHGAITRKSDIYDPNRIPAEVFNRKNQNEWSVTSNESLFSIQIGKSDDVSNYSPLSGYSPISPSLGSASGLNSGPLEMEGGSISGDAKQNTAKETTVKSVAFASDKDTGKQSVSTSAQSTDESIASSVSFAFPILTGEQPNRRSGADQKDSLPSETPKIQVLHQQKLDDDDDDDNNNNNNNNNDGGCGWFSCFSWPPSCWGNQTKT